MRLSSPACLLTLLLLGTPAMAGPAACPPRRDVATGMVLKAVEDQVSGQSYGPATTWTATQAGPLR